MDFPIELAAVEGAKSLCDWFRYWLSLHDVEAIWLHLNRRAPPSVLLHTWEMTKGQAPEKRYKYFSSRLLATVYGVILPIWYS
jgi:hypothetical protein